MKEINISKNITNLRNKKGITQDQLATALNISPQAVSKWETNTSQPDTQMLPLIAEYFDVSLSSMIKQTIPVLISFMVIAIGYYLAMITFFA